MTDINLKGGKLSIEQLNTIFEIIPVEFDFIDENDIIRWSSANRHRLFKRTDADLGKHVLFVLRHSDDTYTFLYPVYPQSASTRSIKSHGR